MRNHRGSSIVMWTVMFMLVFASLTLYRIHLKRAVQDKMQGTVDYLMWTNEAAGGGTVERQEHVEYEGNTNVGRKSVVSFDSQVSRYEKKKEPVQSGATSNQTEQTVYVNVAEGSDPALKLFNMNEAVR
jgi:hypothetical protein